MSKAKERKHFTSRKGAFSVVQNADHIADVCKEREELKRKLEAADAALARVHAGVEGLEKQYDMQKARTEAQREAKLAAKNNEASPHYKLRVEAERAGAWRKVLAKQHTFDTWLVKGLRENWENGLTDDNTDVGNMIRVLDEPENESDNYTVRADNWLEWSMVGNSMIWDLLLGGVINTPPDGWTGDRSDPRWTEFADIARSVMGEARFELALSLTAEEKAAFRGFAMGVKFMGPMIVDALPFEAAVEEEEEEAPPSPKVFGNGSDDDSDDGSEAEAEEFARYKKRKYDGPTKNEARLRAAALRERMPPKFYELVCAPDERPYMVLGTVREAYKMYGNDYAKAALIGKEMFEESKSFNNYPDNPTKAETVEWWAKHRRRRLAKEKKPDYFDPIKESKERAAAEAALLEAARAEVAKE